MKYLSDFEVIRSVMAKFVSDKIAEDGDEDVCRDCLRTVVIDEINCTRNPQELASQLERLRIMPKEEIAQYNLWAKETIAGDYTGGMFENPTNELIPSKIKEISLEEQMADRLAVGDADIH